MNRTSSYACKWKMNNAETCCARDADKTRMTVLHLYTSCKIREHSKLKEQLQEQWIGEKH